jgi:type I restriction enzyme M protein
MANGLNNATNGNGANIGFERELWRAADALRSNMDAAEYKHVVLGLIFLKYISDAFEEHHAKLEAEAAQGADPEDPDEYRAVTIFWVPREARWSHLTASAKQPAIGKVVDDAMIAIERDNPSLKGVLPKDYAHPRLDKQRLGQLIDLIGNIGNIGGREGRSKDILGRVYEYFLSEFASAEGKKGGQFYTPRCVVGLLVEMLAPYQGRVYDPCCGSGGMFVQSEKFVEAHGGRIGDISIYGQESNHTTWRLAMMNLAIRGIDANLGKENADSFHRDLHPDLKADYVLANPPFNDSDWRGDQLKDDKRWQFGIPPASNANYAWVQHFIYHLTLTGLAGFVLANGSMSSNQSGEGEIRKNIIEADLVDCMVALPGQLFYSTPIPVCLWFLARDKKGNRFRNRIGQTLFIDARNIGTMMDRVHRELTDDDIRRIADTYHAWRGDRITPTQYTNVPGFCREITLEQLADAGYDLNPGRYVGVAESGTTEDDLSLQLGECAESVQNAATLAIDLSTQLNSAIRNLSMSLREIMEAIAVRGKSAYLKDIARVSRTMINPLDTPDCMFDLYSIPAFDANGLPEHVSGENILSGKLALSGPSVLVSKLNPRKHRVWPVAQASGNAICSTEFAVLQPRDIRYYDYLYLISISQVFQNHLVSHATGSTGSRQRVKTSDLLAAPIIVPTPEDAVRISEIIAPLRSRLAAIPLETQFLAQLAVCISDSMVACSSSSIGRRA